MAAIQKIRSKSGLLIGVLGVALLAFVLGDAITNGNTFFQNRQDKALAVDGEIVSTKKFQERLTEWEDFEKVNRRTNSLEAGVTMQIKEQVFQQMVKEMMLDDQAEKLGLSVPTEELNDIVYSEDIIPMLYRLRIQVFSDESNGQFDRTRLVSFLEYLSGKLTSSEEEKAMVAEQKQVWDFILNRIKYQRLEDKYLTLIAGSIMVGDTEAKLYVEETKSVEDVAYVVNRYTSVSDSTVNVSDSDIKALYDKRKNEFKLDSELCKVSFFVKDIVPSESDYASVEKEIEKAYKDLESAANPGLVVNQYSDAQYPDAFQSVTSLSPRQKSFVESAQVGQIHGPTREGQAFVMYKLVEKAVAPDSIKLQMIALPPSLNLKASNAIIDSLHTVIKNGKAFGDVANELYPGSSGGEVGWVNEMALSGSGIAKECFAATQGQVIKVTIQGQPQLVRVSEKTKPVAKVKIAEVRMPVIISDKTQNSVDNELSRFISENGTLANFDKAALDKGYAVMPDAIIRPTDMGLGQEADSRNVIQWAFNEQVGAIKKFDLTNKRIVAIKTKDIAKGFVPFDEVKDVLKVEATNDKKAEKIIADLKSKNFTSLEDYANYAVGKVDTIKFVNLHTEMMGIGHEPVLNAYSAIGQPNTLSAPIKGNMGVYVASTINKGINPTPYTMDSAKEKLRTPIYQLVSQSVFALKEKMNVEDNRVKFW